MLLKGFYNIESLELLDKNTVNAKIKLNKEHDIFKGHFPENPVTPGVCMLQVIKEVTEKATGYSLFLKRISNVKFTALINPFENEDLQLEIAILKDDTTLKVKNISKFLDGTIALKCSSMFQKK